MREWGDDADYKSRSIACTDEDSIEASLPALGLHNLRPLPPIVKSIQVFNLIVWLHSIMVKT